MNPAVELSGRQVRAIEAMLAGETQDRVAAVVGISARQLRRWLKLPHVVSELRAQRTRALEQAGTVLAAGAQGCARSLIDLAKSGGPLDAVRLAACRAVLDLAARFETETTTTARIEELETQLSPKTEKKSWQ